MPMHPVIYSCLVDYIKGQLGSFTHEIFSTDSHVYRDDYFSTRKLLCTMCLVNSDWRPLAQRALQRRIVLRSRRGIQSFTENCQLGPWMRELYLEPVVVQPFEEEFDVSSESGSEDSDDSDAYDLFHIRTGNDLNRPPAEEGDWFLETLLHLSEALIPNLPNLVCLGINMRHYSPHYDTNGCIVDFIDALQRTSHLRGLFLLDTILCGESATEPFLIPLFHRIAKLPFLSHLWISNFGSMDRVANEKLPSVLQHILPPPRLKTIGFEVPDARLPHAILSWLVTPQGKFAPECIVASIQNRNDLANDDLLRVLSLPTTITRLHLDFTVFGCNASTVNIVSSILPSLTSLRDLRIGYELAIELRAFAPSVTQLWLEFVYPQHFFNSSPDKADRSICDIVSSGQAPHLKTVTFCILCGSEAGPNIDVRDLHKYPLAAALRNQGIDSEIELLEISAQRRVLADSFGCPS